MRPMNDACQACGASAGCAWRRTHQQPGFRIKTLIKPEGLTACRQCQPKYGKGGVTGAPAVRSTQPPSRSQRSPSAASSGVRSTCVGRNAVLQSAAGQQDCTKHALGRDVE